MASSTSATKQLEEVAAGYAANRLDATVSPEVQERASLTEVSAYNQLALAQLMRGELAAAETALANAERLTHGFGFPEGQFSLAFVRFVEIWLRLETGELERAAAAAADVTEMGERHGLKIIRLFGVTWQAGVDAVGALAGDDPDSGVLAQHIRTMTDRVDTLRSVEVNEFVTFFDSVIGRLLIADDQMERARACLDAALQFADDSEMSFYNPELLRLRARTHEGVDARAADIDAAKDLARRQDAHLFELRAALDDISQRGDSARAELAEVVGRFPAQERWAELAMARSLT